jgi:hypothetical protein
MDIDGPIEHHRTVVPVKKYKDRFLMGHPRYQHRHFDNSFNVTHNMLLPKVNEKTKHSYDTHRDISRDRGHYLNGSLPRKHTKVSCDTVKRNGIVCNQAWTELGDHGEYDFSHKANTDNTDNHLQSVHGFTARKDDCFCGTSVENHDCDQSCPLNDEGGTVPSRQRFVMDTFSEQDCYLHEVEVLGSKLRELRGSVDGKRLRQRSESEPGAGFGCSGQGSSWEPKRARDGSPGLTENLDHCYVEDTKHSSYAQHQLQGSDSHSSHLQVIHLHRPSVRRGRDTKVSS